MRLADLSRNSFESSRPVARDAAASSIGSNRAAAVGKNGSTGRAPRHAKPDGLALYVSAMCLRDEQAFEALHGACELRLRACAISIVRRFELAEEIVSSSFVQAWYEASHYDHARGPVIAWLLMITRSRSLDALRREACRASHEVLLGDDELEGSGGSGCTGPEVSLERIECSRTLRAMLGMLPRPQREAIGLAFMQGMTYAEVAKHTGLALGTTKSHIQRGLATLRHRCTGSALAP